MFDRSALADALARHGRVARVVVAGVHGSHPREVGAAMLVWEDVGRGDGQAGTIGGGALEYRAAQMARAMLAKGESARLDRIALGPELGQCCGGAVHLVSEVYRDVPAEGPSFARPVQPGAGDMPLAIARLEARARQGLPIKSQLERGWLIEPFAAPRENVWIWGAGHVGRALIAVLAPLPHVAITWVDSALARFPADIPGGVAALPAAQMPCAIALAPRDAHHVIVTFSHAIDLALCDGLLRHGFASLGLIGSASKAARFRARLAGLGHGGAEISRIICPIGDTGLGKHPQAIAIGVAGAMIRSWSQAAPRPNQEAQA